MDLMELSAILRLDTSQYERQAKKAEKDGKGLAGKVQKTAGALSVAMGNILAHGIEATAKAVTSVVGKSLRAAGELEQQLGGVEAVFGEFRHNMIDYARQSWKSLGLTESQYLSFANKMGSLLQGSGIDQQRAGEITVEVMQRAADVASIMGISVEDAMTAVTGAAKGNFTMMDNLGVAINDTALNAYALEKGLNKTTKEMTTGEKVMLAYELFLEKTSYAAGNYTKENDTFAGSITTLEAAWGNLLSGVGDGTEVVEALVGKNGEGGALGAVFKTAEKVLPKLWDGLTKGVKAAWPKVTKFLGEKLDKLPTVLGPMITDGANGIIDIINGIFGTNIPHVDIQLPSLSEMGARISEWWNADSGVGKILHDVCDWTIGLFSPPEVPDDATVSERLDAWWGQTVTHVQKACAWALGLFTNVDGTETDVTKNIKTWWTDLGITVADVGGWLISKATGVEGDKGEIAGIIKKWWDGLGETTGKLVNWALDLPSGMKSANEKGQDLRAILQEAWGTATEGLDSLIRWTFGIPDPADPSGVKTIQRVQRWWSEKVKPKLDLVADFTLGLLGYDNIDQLLFDFERKAVVAFADLMDAIGIAGLLGIDTQAIRNGAAQNYEAKMAELEQKLAEGYDPNESAKSVLKRAFAEAYSVPGAGEELTPEEIGQRHRVPQAEQEGLQESTGGGRKRNVGAEGEVAPVGGNALDKIDLEVAGLGEQVGDMNSAMSGVADAATNAANALNGISIPSALRSNAKGLDYVPYSGYLTELHKGEAILSGNEAREWREHGGRGQDYDSTNALLGAIQGLGNKLGNMQMYVGERAFGGVVVDYGGRGMNRYIGGMEQRKRRGLGRR